MHPVALLCAAFPALLAQAAPAPSQAAAPSPAGSLEEALASIRAEDLLACIRTLGSDEFEGRAPGTPGEERTVAWLTEAFGSLGLAPGGAGPGFAQEVSLVGFQAAVSARVELPAGHFELASPADFVAASRRLEATASVADSELVFVGYGVSAPEYGWDDYKGVDVAGKTLVMLVGDPAVARADAPRELDPAAFRGRAMTYYGRWTYKYEVAAERGAAAVLLVHEDDAAGYPWEVVTSSFARENFEVPDPAVARRVAVEAWIRRERAIELLAACGQDFADLKRRSARRDFAPVPLGARARIAIENRLREVRSRNVAARLPGSDPARAGELLVFTAHWDHLGRDAGLSGDQIYNGALDNASGTAGLVELAQAFAGLRPAPARSILFLAVTAEEKGLLGSKYYAAHPLHPLERTLAVINMDGLNVLGRTEDLVSLGLGQTTLDDRLAALAAAEGRELAGDPEPEKGSYFRSDHFSFARRGVPALSLGSGVRYRDRPAGWGLEKRREYTRLHYHKVSDEVREDWDLSGAAEDLRLLFRLGLDVAGAEAWPEWKPGSEFRAARAAMLRGSGG